MGPTGHGTPFSASYVSYTSYPPPLQGTASINCIQYSLKTWLDSQ